MKGFESQPDIEKFKPDTDMQLGDIEDWLASLRQKNEITEDEIKEFHDRLSIIERFDDEEKIGDAKKELVKYWQEKKREYLTEQEKLNNNKQAA